MASSTRSSSRETRGMIARNLRLYKDKNVSRPARKHGNIPL